MQLIMGYIELNQYICDKIFRGLCGELNFTVMLDSSLSSKVQQARSITLLPDIDNCGCSTSVLSDRFLSSSYQSILYKNIADNKQGSVDSEHGSGDKLCQSIRVDLVGIIVFESVQLHHR